MLNRAELERALALSYPKDISQLTQNKRKRNIESLERLIESANQTERLVFGSREERICLYTTSVGERITIQYPGCLHRFPTDTQTAVHGKLDRFSWEY